MITHTRSALAMLALALLWTGGTIVGTAEAQSGRFGRSSWPELVLDIIRA
jgi:hypothetical protein